MTDLLTQGCKTFHQKNKNKAGGVDNTNSGTRKLEHSYREKCKAT
jgi:hypothetical protein